MSLSTIYFPTQVHINYTSVTEEINKNETLSVVLKSKIDDGKYIFWTKFYDPKNYDKLKTLTNTDQDPYSLMVCLNSETWEFEFHYGMRQKINKKAFITVNGEKKEVTSKALICLYWLCENYDKFNDAKYHHAFSNAIQLEDGFKILGSILPLFEVDKGKQRYPVDKEKLAKTISEIKTDNCGDQLILMVEAFKRLTMIKPQTSPNKK